MNLQWRLSKELNRRRRLHAMTGRGKGGTRSDERLGEVNQSAFW